MAEVTTLRQLAILFQTSTFAEKKLVNGKENALMRSVTVVRRIIFMQA